MNKACPGLRTRRYCEGGERIELGNRPVDRTRPKRNQQQGISPQFNAQGSVMRERKRQTKRDAPLTVGERPTVTTPRKDLILIIITDKTGKTKRGRKTYGW
jgi:hypothetical protein